MTLTPAAFDWVRSIVEAEAAIVIEPGKEYLVESRLAPLARAAGANDVSAYIDQLRRGPSRQVAQLLVEAMTTNETSWFRDGSPYELFETSLVPQLRTMRGSARQVRIWSAACSTGQEPYSLAILLRESLVREGWRTEIVATDIDEKVLAKARAGTYSQLEMNRGLPAAKLVQHFVRAGAGWRVSDELRAAVQFQRLNLAGPFPPMGQFDVVFLRNVLIYFSVETRRTILQQVRRMCRPDGYLVLGGAETTLGVDDQWERVVFGRATAYRPMSTLRAA
jgi:chemotaxis protein methyltransferase CheR